MNIFAKIKLKSMLRNCNYELAGDVLKQQYYDFTKKTELNRLIDQYMENPCFDQAVKLIKYNDMFVYYFTESCHGGLYVRKSEQLHAADVNIGRGSSPTDDTELITGDKVNDLQVQALVNEQADELEPALAKMVQTETADELIERARQSVAKKLAELEKKHQNSELGGESPAEPIHIVFPPVRPKGEKSKLEDNIVSFPAADIAEAEVEPIQPDEPTIEEQSEELLREASPTQHWDQQEALVAESSNLHELEAAPTQEAWNEPSGEAEQLFETETREFNVEPVVQTSSMPEELEHKATTEESKGLINVNALVQKLTKSHKKTKTTDHEGSQPLKAMEKEVKLKEEPQELPPLSMNVREIEPQHTKFPNVISTLMIDIEDMARQMEDFQAQMFQQPQDAVKLKKWANTLGEAIEEFEAAVKVLSRYK